jgi:hypothetical protein
LAPFFACRSARAKTSLQDGTSTASAELPRGFSRHHCRGDGDIQRPHRRLQGNDETSTGGGMNLGRYTGGLAAEKQDIPGQIAESREGQACLGVVSRTRSPASVTRRQSSKAAHLGYRGDLNMGKVIRAGPAEMFVARQKARGFDNRGGEPKTGAHPQYRARVLRDVWRIERHRQRREPVGLHFRGHAFSG